MIKKIQILLIEENRILREGISALLNKQQDFKVIPNDDTEDVLPLIDKLKPDVVLVDIELKYHNSLQLIKDIIAKYKDCKIVVLDLIPTQADVLEYIQAGVLGFILKEADNTHFIKAIRKVARGLKVLPPSLTGELFSQITENKNIQSKPDVISQLVKMTKREMEIVKLIAD
ncbi:MAG: DNA-binding response regulator, partial [Ignavibacteriales bacterium]